jgi:centromere protein C
MFRKTGWMPVRQVRQDPDGLDNVDDFFADSDPESPPAARTPVSVPSRRSFSVDPRFYSSPIAYESRSRRRSIYPEEYDDEYIYYPRRQPRPRRALVPFSDIYSPEIPSRRLSEYLPLEEIEENVVLHRTPKSVHRRSIQPYHSRVLTPSQRDREIWNEDPLADKPSRLSRRSPSPVFEPGYEYENSEHVEEDSYEAPLVHPSEYHDEPVHEEYYERTETPTRHSVSRHSIASTPRPSSARKSIGPSSRLQDRVSSASRNRIPSERNYYEEEPRMSLERPVEKKKRSRTQGHRAVQEIIRYKASLPPVDEGARRSARPRLKPLEYWKGEKVRYRGESVGMVSKFNHA